MNAKRIKQSDYMSMQLMEIEHFRLSLARQSHEKITFQEAVMLWFSEGYADKFNDGFFKKTNKIEPAIA